MGDCSKTVTAVGGVSEGEEMAVPSLVHALQLLHCHHSSQDVSLLHRFPARLQNLPPTCGRKVVEHRWVLISYCALWIALCCLWGFRGQLGTIREGVLCQYR